MAVTSFPHLGETPEDVVDIWTSDEYLEENADPDAEILLTDSSSTVGAVLYTDYLSDGTELVTYREVYVLEDDETVVIVSLLGEPGSFTDALEDARDGVELESDPVFDLIELEDIEAEL